MLQIYVAEHMIATNVTLSSIAFTLIALFGVFTAIPLYPITRLAKK
jgi:hypothetical protein